MDVWSENVLPAGPLSADDGRQYQDDQYQEGDGNKKPHQQPTRSLLDQRHIVSLKVGLTILQLGHNYSGCGVNAEE